MVLMFPAAMAPGMIASGQVAGFSIPARIAASNLTLNACAMGSRSSAQMSYAEKNVDGHIVPGSKTGEDRARSVTPLAPLRRDLLAFRLAAGNPPDEALVFTASRRPALATARLQELATPLSQDRALAPCRKHLRRGRDEYRPTQRDALLPPPHLRQPPPRGAAPLAAGDRRGDGPHRRGPRAHVRARHLGVSRPRAYRPRRAHRPHPMPGDAPKTPQAPPPTAGTLEADGGTRTPDPIITRVSGDAQGTAWPVFIGTSGGYRRPCARGATLQGTPTGRHNWAARSRPRAVGVLPEAHAVIQTRAVWRSRARGRTGSPSAGIGERPSSQSARSASVPAGGAAAFEVRQRP